MSCLLARHARSAAYPIEPHAKGSSWTHSCERLESGANLLTQSTLEGVEHVTSEVENTDRGGEEPRVPAGSRTVKSPGVVVVHDSVEPTAPSSLHFRGDESQVLSATDASC